MSVNDPNTLSNLGHIDYLLVDNCLITNNFVINNLLVNTENYIFEQKTLEQEINNLNNIQLVLFYIIKTPNCISFKF